MDKIDVGDLKPSIDKPINLVQYMIRNNLLSDGESMTQKHSEVYDDEEEILEGGLVGGSISSVRKKTTNICMTNIRISIWL